MLYLLKRGDTMKLADKTLLYQYDTGVYVEANSDEVHFAVRPYGYSVDVEVKNGKAQIPDFLLATAEPLKMWAFVKTENGGYTREDLILPVKPRNKPADYVYTPTDQITLESVVKQMGNLNDLKTHTKDNLVGAINELEVSGGGGGYQIGNGLKLDVETNTLSVDATNSVEQDNTLPITSAGVYVTVGNINALLDTI